MIHCTFARRSYAIAATALLALGGCAGNGEGLDQNGRPLGEGSSGGPLVATFDSIQDNVFTPVCAHCHSGASAPQGLRLDEGNSYALLVGVNSAEVPSLKRVNAGNPDASYLVQKISGTASFGGRMPLDGPPYLPQSTIDVIRQWITNGAPKTSSASAPTISAQMIVPGLRVETTAPQNGDRVTTQLSQIVIGFDRELDANLVNATTVTLERLDDHTTVAADLAVPVVSPSTLLVTVNQPLRNGVYRLTLRGSGGGALAGLDARPLNSPGDFVSGQDVAIEFTVEVQ